MKQYIGRWLSGKHHGHGKAIYANEDVYEGEFVNGNREGRGSYTFNRHYKYTGEWQNNLFHGKGRLYRRNDLFFEGMFAAGLKQGPGMYKYENGDKF
jgi:hypothetical protein